MTRRAQVTLTFGSLVRSQRRHLGLSLEVLAERVDTSAPHLSRIERGERGHLGLELRDRLAEELGLPPESILEADPRLPADAERDLADPALARVVFAHGRLAPRARVALRRANLALLAEEFTTTGSELDTKDLLGRAGIVAAERQSNEHDLELEWPAAWLRPALSDERRRFAEMHAVGHSILSDAPVCDWGSPAEAEAEATALAGFILLPRPSLGRAVRAAASRFDIDPWPADGAELIAAVARALVAPAWLVARRASEEGFLAAVAGQADL
jgi:transcriptional regulator with XRE-family HTH domain